MQNKSEEIEVTLLHETDQLASWMRNEMDSKVSSSSNNCRIYKIPEFIRKQKEQCYTPEVLSIGPMYYGNPELETMEKLKWVTLKWFLEHPHSGGHNLEYYLQFIREKEEQICECYQDTNKCNLIPKHEFRAMILRDAAFIFYLFIHRQTMEQLAIPDEMRVLRRSQTDRDLFLLENQMPYFILKSLYDVSFGMVLQVSFIEVTRDYIGTVVGFTLPGSKTINSQVAIDKIVDATCIDHLLDFVCRCLQHQRFEQPQIRCLMKPKKNNNKVYETIKKAAHYVSTTLIPSNRRPSVQNQLRFPSSVQNQLILPKSAKQLSDAGVRFKVSKSIHLLDISYADGVLEIPKIDLDDNTESAIRNITYFEQCRYPDHSCFIDYVCFLDELINTTEDIQILVENKILDSVLGSHREAADLFNKVATKMTLSDYFLYTDISQKMNDYASNSWHRWKAILKRDYFNHPWSVISVTYLVIILILTILQVYTGFKASC